MKVFKYVLPTAPDSKGTVVVEMPDTAQILSVANQSEKLVCWARVPRAGKPVLVRFLLAETGQDFVLPVNSRFIGTVMFDRGSYVLHVWGLAQTDPVISDQILSGIATQADLGDRDAQAALIDQARLRGIERSFVEDQSSWFEVAKAIESRR